MTTVHTVPLCDMSDLPPVVLDQRQNPAFPVKNNSDAYLDLQECQTLVAETFAHLQLQQPPKVVLAWDRSTKRHGRARKVMAQDEVTARVEDYNTRVKVLRKMMRAKTMPYADVIEANSFLQAEARALKTLVAQKRAAAGGDIKALHYEISLSQIVFHSVNVTERIDTVIHEACHVVAFEKHPVDVGHGPEWQALMVRCGVPPEAKASAAAGSPRIVCPNCGLAARTGPKVIAQLRGGRIALGCRKCGTRLGADNLEVPEEYERSRPLQQLPQVRPDVAGAPAGEGPGPVAGGSPRAGRTYRLT